MLFENRVAEGMVSPLVRAEDRPSGPSRRLRPDADARSGARLADRPFGGWVRHEVAGDALSTMPASPPPSPAAPAGGQPGGSGRRLGVGVLPIVLVALGLLAVNFWIASNATQYRGARARPVQPSSSIGRAGRTSRMITSTGTAVQGTFRHAGALSRARHSTDERGVLDRDPRVRGHGRPRGTAPEPRRRHQRRAAGSSASLFQTLRLGFGPTLVFLGLLFLDLPAGLHCGRQSSGRSRARAHGATTWPRERVTFADVAGIDEAEDELAEIVDFLPQPGQVPRSSARASRAACCSRGRPARARRCSRGPSPARPESRSSRMSASEFVEMIVGVGASRARDLFAQAKAAAPSIIFIDELDAIGRARAAAPTASAGTTSASRRSTRS